MPDACVLCANLALLDVTTRRPLPHCALGLADLVATISETTRASRPDGAAGSLAITDFAIVQLSSGTTGHRKAVEFTATALLLRHVTDYNAVLLENDGVAQLIDVAIGVTADGRNGRRVSPVLPVGGKCDPTAFHPQPPAELPERNVDLALTSANTVGQLDRR